MNQPRYRGLISADVVTPDERPYRIKIIVESDHLDETFELPTALFLMTNLYMTSRGRSIEDRNVVVATMLNATDLFLDSLPRQKIPAPEPQARPKKLSFFRRMMNYVRSKFLSAS